MKLFAAKPAPPRLPITAPSGSGAHQASWVTAAVAMAAQQAALCIAPRGTGSSFPGHGVLPAAPLTSSMVVFQIWVMSEDFP